jgi:hypothetical protein
VVDDVIGVCVSSSTAGADATRSTKVCDADAVLERAALLVAATVARAPAASTTLTHKMRK